MRWHNGFHLRGRKTVAVLAGQIALSLARIAHAESADIPKILDLITQTADKICNVVSTTGEANSSEVKGQVKAQLSGLAAKLADVGVSGSGSIINDQYQNVLRQDLATTLQNNAACKLKVFETLQARLLGPADPPKASRPIVCSISGFIFDQDSNKPLSAVSVDLYRDLEHNRPTLLKGPVAVTGPDGKFSFDCGGIKETEYPLRLAVHHQDWVETILPQPPIARSGQWSGINIPVSMSHLHLRALRELELIFDEKQIGSDWFLTGFVENKSQHSFNCVSLKFHISTSYQDKMQGEPDRDLGFTDVEVRNLGPNEKRPYQSKLPKRVGLDFVSKQEC